MPLITAEQAKSNAKAFNLSKEQVLAKVAQSISANSNAGKREISMKFLRAAVSTDELEYVKAKLLEKNYEVSDLAFQAKDDSHGLRIKW